MKTASKLLALLVLAASLLFGGAAEAQNGSFTTSASVQFTPSAAAYSAGQCVGPAAASAVLTLPLVQNQGSGGFTLQDATLMDSAGQGAATDMYVFTSVPQGTYTDAATCTITNTTDQANVIGPMSFTAGVAFGTPKSFHLLNLWTAINTTPSTTVGAPVVPRTVWVVLVTRGTPTYGAAATVTLRLGGLTDIR